MPEGLGPTIQTVTGEQQPYQEQKELLGKLHFDSLIVFGNGPIKPLLRPEQLTPEQQRVWENFKLAPLQNNEPEFRVLEVRADEGNIQEKQGRWQQAGRFGLNRWGRQGALAAGLALYLGVTDRLILSGGKTMPSWAKDVLDENTLANWPSEASLMRDIIIRRYGDLFKERYGKSIEECLTVEGHSTNTLENFAYTINNSPGLTGKEKVGLMGADFHIRRISELAHIFSVWEAPRGQLSSQELLRERATIRNKDNYNEMQRYLRDALRNPDLRQRLEGEERWERGLIDESYLSYWLGYLSQVEDPAVIQQVMTALNDPSWKAQATREFQKVGLDFDHFAQEDLVRLSTDETARYDQLIEGLRRLQSEFRQFPPSTQS